MASLIDRITRLARSPRGQRLAERAQQLEFAADASGPEITGDPLALASILSKIEQVAQRRPLPATAATGPVGSLMIADPFSGRSPMRMFSTHPDSAERITRLRAMAMTER